MERARRERGFLTPKRVGGALVAAIVVGLAASAISVLRAQPLEHLTSRACCRGVPGGGSTPMLAGDLVNNGRVTVRITEIEAPAWLEVRLDLRKDAEDVGTARGVRRFRPFTLPPQGRRWVAFVARVPNCAENGDRDDSFSSARIRYELLGLERTARVRVQGIVGPLTYSRTARCAALGSG